MGKNYLLSINTFSSKYQQNIFETFEKMFEMFVFDISVLNFDVFSRITLGFLLRGRKVIGKQSKNATVCLSKIKYVRGNMIVIIRMIQ